MIERMKEKKYSWKLYIPLYLIFISLLLFATRNFDQAQSSAVGLSNIHKIFSIPLSIAIVLYYFLQKQKLPKVPCALKAYIGFILIGLTGSLMFSNWIGYSIFKLLEITAVVLVVLYGLSLNIKYKDILFQFYEKILSYYQVLLLLTVLGVFIFPSLAIRPPTIYREAFLPYQLFGSIIQINANSLGIMSAILFYVTFTRLYNKKNFISFNFIWLFLSGIIMIFAQSRTSIIGLVIIIFLFLFLNGKSGILGKIFMLSTFLGGIYLSISSILKYMTRGLTSSQIENLSGRAYWWEYAWNKFQTFDIWHQVFGSGYMVGSRMILADMGHSDASTLHSDFMDSLVSTGYLGLGFIILMIICTSFILLKNIKYVRKTPYLLEWSGIFVLLTVRAFTGPTIATHNFFLIMYLIVIASIFVKLKQIKAMRRS